MPADSGGEWNLVGDSSPEVAAREKTLRRESSLFNRVTKSGRISQAKKGIHTYSICNIHLHEERLLTSPCEREVSPDCLTGRFLPALREK